MRDVEHCDLAALVDLDQGRISPRLFVDPEIYRLELEKIFARCWIFLAHESQIRESGEYVTTRRSTSWTAWPFTRVIWQSACFAIS